MKTHKTVGNYSVTVNNGILEMIEFDNFREGGVIWEHGIKYATPELERLRSILIDIFGIDNGITYRVLMASVNPKIDKKMPTNAYLRRAVRSRRVKEVNQKIKRTKLEIKHLYGYLELLEDRKKSIK